MWEGAQASGIWNMQSRFWVNSPGWAGEQDDGSQLALRFMLMALGYKGLCISTSFVILVRSDTVVMMRNMAHSVMVKWGPV